jgi:hypothetical protein
MPIIGGSIVPVSDTGPTLAPMCRSVTTASHLGLKGYFCF